MILAFLKLEMAFAFLAGVMPVSHEGAAMTVLARPAIISVMKVCILEIDLMFH